MGAINYFTSDYITIGLNPLDRWDLEKDTCFMEELQKDVNEYGGDIDTALESYINDCNENDYINTVDLLNKYCFSFFHVAIKPGYYDGFSIDIEFNYPVCFDWWEQRAQAQKEITEIKQFLLSCVDIGLVQVFPGWVTSYARNDVSASRRNL